MLQRPAGTRRDRAAGRGVGLGERGRDARGARSRHRPGAVPSGAARGDHGPPPGGAARSASPPATTRASDPAPTILRTLRGRVGHGGLAEYLGDVQEGVDADERAGIGPVALYVAETATDGFITMSAWRDWADVEHATGGDIHQPRSTRHREHLVDWDVAHYEIVQSAIGRGHHREHEGRGRPLEGERVGLLRVDARARGSPWPPSRRSARRSAPAPTSVAAAMCGGSISNSARRFSRVSLRPKPSVPSDDVVRRQPARDHVGQRLHPVGRGDDRAAVARQDRR